MSPPPHLSKSDLSSIGIQSLKIGCYKVIIFSTRLYLMVVVPCVTSKSGMLLFLNQRYTSKEHIKGNQQRKNVKIRYVIASIIFNNS